MSRPDYKNIAINLILLLLLSACGAHVHHQVKPGESLYAIGWQYGQDYRDIARWNQLPPPYVIQPGQWLRVAPPNRPWWADQYPEKFAQSQTQSRPQSGASSGSQVATPSAVSSSQLPQKSVSSGAGTSSASSVATKPIQSTSAMSAGSNGRSTASLHAIKKWKWPVNTRIPATRSKNSQYKKGVIFRDAVGAPVYATAAGQVVYRGSGLLGYGKLIIIKHNKTYLSAYGNNARMLVGEGDRVSIGQQIATIGQTTEGDALLYFEIRKNGKPVDPISHLRPHVAQ